MEGILYALRTGVPWRDLPAGFGAWSTMYSRFRKRSQKGLWDLLAMLEEDINAPACLIELAASTGSPVRVVGNGDYHHFPAVNGDDPFNSSQQGRMPGVALRGLQQDEIVAQNVVAGFAQESPLHTVKAMLPALPRRHLAGRGCGDG